MTAPTEATSKSFTSWKLDVWNAISMDAELNPTERIVAWRLLRRASAGGEIYPAQETIAIETALSRQTVKLSVAVLVRRGWVTTRRENRRKSNRYFFADNLVEVIEKEVHECVTEKLTRVRKRTFKKALDGTKADHLEGTNSDQMTVQKRTPNTYELSPEVEHLKDGYDEEGDTQGDQATDHQPPGAVAPHNASRDGGRVTTPTPSAAIINSTAYKRELASRTKVDPFTSLDRLEAEQIKRRAGGAR